MKEKERKGVERKKGDRKEEKVPMQESNPWPLNLQPSLPLSHCLRVWLYVRTYYAYIQIILDFDDLTVAAHTPPISTYLLIVN